MSWIKPQPIIASRKVFNNLGVCYYRKAFRYDADWRRRAKKDDPELKLKLSVQIAPETPFHTTRSSSGASQQERFRNAPRQAIRHFKKALRLDEDYLIALNNIACTY